MKSLYCFKFRSWGKAIGASLFLEFRNYTKLFNRSEILLIRILNSFLSRNDTLGNLNMTVSKIWEKSN